MDEHILVPYDGSPLSERALERALTTSPDARVTVLHVVDPIEIVYEVEAGGPPTDDAWRERVTARAESVTAEAEVHAADLGREVETAVETGRPSREILAYVAASDVDHVVMGSHGRSGISRLVLGSVAEQVMRQCPVPVTVVR